jgi:hypothetical protein
MNLGDPSGAIAEMPIAKWLARFWRDQPTEKRDRELEPVNAANVAGTLCRPGCLKRKDSIPSEAARGTRALWRDTMSPVTKISIRPPGTSASRCRRRPTCSIGCREDQRQRLASTQCLL